LPLRCEKLRRDITPGHEGGIMPFCRGKHVTVLENEELHSLAWEAAPSH
jgi:hypothetical protein